MYPENRKQTKSIGPLFLQLFLACGSLQIFALQQSWGQEAQCKVPTDLDAPKDETNRKNCLALAHFALKQPPLINASQAAEGPKLDEVTFRSDETVYCRYFYRYQNGASNKFRCYRTNEKNQLLNVKGEVITKAVRVGDFESEDEADLFDAENQPILDAKGKPEQADILKVRFQDGSARHRENYASTVASRFAWIMGFPMENYYSVKAITCFGCQENPWQEGITPQLAPLPNIKNSFLYPSIERKFNAKRVYKPYAPKDKQNKSIAWSWSDFSPGVATMPQDRRVEFESLILFANLFQVVEHQGLQHVLLCEKEFYKKQERTCGTTLAAIHDMGAAFGNRVMRLPELDNNHPRADFNGYAAVNLFNENSKCEIGYNPAKFGAFLPASFEDFKARLSLLQPDIVESVLRSAHFQYADLPFRKRVEQELRASKPKFTVQDLDDLIIKKWKDLILLKMSEHFKAVKAQNCD